MRLLNHPPSPVQELHAPLFAEKGIRLLVKRDDLLSLSENGGFCGNKWRKMKYNLLEARLRGQNRLLTFGGAFSNHISAVAEAGQSFGFETIGVIRGEAPASPSPTLQQAAARGMHLHYTSRSEFQRKNNPDWIAALLEQYGDCYVLPEGGTNRLALDGCRDMVEEVFEQCAGNLPHYYCVACGTGGTLAGIITGLNNTAKAIGFSVLKGGFMRDAVIQLLLDYGVAPSDNWEIQEQYHFGGYAKTTPELFVFMKTFYREYGIPLDQVYTAKLFYGLFDLIRNGYFAPGSSIMVIHTGGLQGNSKKF
ncbi:MAG: 1-aminocyclopropane-1-carboxylate deaminase/D-cysteine desulfhydrase [Saprospiraceae bacterium]|nr:1-aminocyclopropane-1-carboxylate deaminase/D-cysteine desulfhydrase [Saprospiraceae bacterium]